MKRVAALAVVAVLSSCTSTAATAHPSTSAAGALPSSATGAARPAAPSGPAKNSTAPATTGAGPSTGTPVAGATSLRVTSVGTLPYPLSRMATVADGSRILLLGGLKNAGSSGDVLSFDTAGHGVRLLGHLEQAVHDTAAGSLSGQVLLVGGGAAAESSDVQRLLASGATTRVGKLPQPRSDLNVVTIGSTLYVVGGYTGTQELADVLATTDGVHFRVVARLKQTVRYAAVVAVGTDIWVIGGDHLKTPTAAVQRIDTRTGRVTLVGRLAHPLGHASAWLTPAGTVLVAGGNLTNSTHTDAIARFDPRTLSLTRAGRLPRPMSDMGVAVVGGVAYLFGGEATHRVTSVVAVR